MKLLRQKTNPVRAVRYMGMMLTNVPMYVKTIATDDDGRVYGYSCKASDLVPNEEIDGCFAF